MLSLLIAVNGMLTSHCRNLSTYHYHVTYHPCFDTQFCHGQTTQQYFRAVAMSSRKKRKRSSWPFVQRRAVKRKLVRQSQIVQSVMQDCLYVLSHLLPVCNLLVQGPKITYNYCLSRWFNFRKYLVCQGFYSISRLETVRTRNGYLGWDTTHINVYPEV